MARLARVVIPGLAHHVTQRGNGRQQVFFSDSDYALYLRLITEASCEAGVGCLAFCLMPNHAHLILVPATPDGLRRSLFITHRAYAAILNARRDVTGHFWQGRFGSVPMDDAHLYETLRYVLLNQGKARSRCDGVAVVKREGVPHGAAGRPDELSTDVGCDTGHAGVPGRCPGHGTARTSAGCRDDRQASGGSGLHLSARVKSPPRTDAW